MTQPSDNNPKILEGATGLEKLRFPLNKKWFWIGGIGLLLAVGIGWAIFQGKSIGAAEEQKKSQHTINAFAEDISMVRMNAQGKPVESIKAPKLVHYEDDGVTELLNPFFEYFDEQGNPWQLTANYGQVNPKTHEIYLWENVKGLQNFGAQETRMHFSTSALTIDPKTQVARTDRPVQFTQGDSRLNAVGMNVSFKTNTVKFLSKVVGVYSDAKSES